MKSQIPYKREEEGDFTHILRKTQCENGTERDLKFLNLKIGIIFKSQAKFMLWLPETEGDKV